MDSSLIKGSLLSTGPSPAGNFSPLLTGPSPATDSLTVPPTGPSPAGNLSALSTGPSPATDFSTVPPTGPSLAIDSFAMVEIASGNSLPEKRRFFHIQPRTLSLWRRSHHRRQCLANSTAACVR